MSEENVEVDEIKTAFEIAVEGSETEDDTKMAMIGAGATFKNVTRLYNQYMIDAGHAISKADKDSILSELLEDVDLLDEELFIASCSGVMEGITGTTERSAAAMVRAYAKKNGLDCYSKPVGSGAPRNSFASGFYDFLAGNPTMSSEDAEAYIMGTGDHTETSSNVQRSKSHYLGIHALVGRIAA